MEHIRALEQLFETLDPEEVKFYCGQMRKVMNKFKPKVTHENTGKVWSKDEEAELVRLRDSGASFKDVAEHMKRSTLAVLLRYEQIKNQNAA